MIMHAFHPNEAGVGVKRGGQCLSISFLWREIEWRESISNNQWFLTFENVMQANNFHFRRMKIFQVSYSYGFAHPQSPPWTFS